VIGVGIIGYGFMGRIHASAYLADPRAKIVAISDPNPDRFRIEVVEGNLEAQEQVFDPANANLYDSIDDLLADSDVDAVSVCSPTAQHVPMAIAALRAGKHVLVEKPLALSYAEAMKAVDVASQASTLVAMPAMCMRFWPGWTWLKEAIAEERYGRVLAATFTRLGTMPTWASFYRDDAQSGGAILDLHIHDADFVRYCFGDPASVSSLGYSATTAGVDHVVTHYHYDEGPPIVVAEGGWTMKPGFPFTMRYVVNFERASAVYDLQSDPPLIVSFAEGEEQAVEIPTGAGYEREVSAFLDCIERGVQPEIVTLRDAAESVRMIETERRSIQTRQPQPFAHVAANMTS